jgi:hypothetical protein
MGLLRSALLIFMATVISGCERDGPLFDVFDRLPDNVSVYDGNFDNIADIMVGEGYVRIPYFGRSDGSRPLIGRVDDDMYVDHVFLKEGKVYCRYGKGGGVFGKPVKLYFPEIPGDSKDIKGIAGADIDKDGDLDLVVTFPLGHINYFNTYRNNAIENLPIIPGMEKT